MTGRLSWVPTVSLCCLLVLLDRSKQPHASGMVPFPQQWAAFSNFQSISAPPYWRCPAQVFGLCNEKGREYSELLNLRGSLENSCNKHFCLASMKGQSLSPVKAQCPSVGECQDREVGVDGLVSRERGDVVGSCSRGKRKGNNIWNVNKENI